MAELAVGAVSSLLGVIRNEAVLLGRVHSDVQFIKEEMESMRSFLTHLATTAPAGGEHDEQVRTWMNQVRLLAQDCNNCIDLYLYRGNPDIHRARRGLRRYLWWVPWFLHKLAAQHRAAIQLGELKERARDVGERRLRYGVEVPVAKSPEGKLLPAARLASAQAAALAAARGYAAGDDEEEDGDDHLVVAMATDHSRQRTFYEPPTLDDYVKEKLTKWTTGIPEDADETMSFVIVAPETDPDALSIAIEVLVFTSKRFSGAVGYDRAVSVDIPAMHINYLPLRPKEVLFYILRELKQGTDGGREKEKEEKYLDLWEAYNKKIGIYHEKKQVLYKIKENIKEMKIYQKLGNIKSDIRAQPLKSLEHRKNMDQLDLATLLQLLLQSAAAASEQDQAKNKVMYKLPAWDDNIITKIAKKLKDHMEADENGKLHKEKMGEEGEAREGEQKEVEEEKEREGRREHEELVEEEEHKGGGGGREEEEEEHRGGVEGGGREEEEESQHRHMAPICLHIDQYAHILRKVFPKPSNNKPQQAHQEDRSTAKQASKTKEILGEQATKATLDKDQIKQIVHEAISELQEGKYDKNLDTGEPGTPFRNPEAVFADIEQKIDQMEQEIKEQLKIKGLVDDIKHDLKDECPLFVLKVDEKMDVSRWEDTRNALSLLECSADVLIVTTTMDIQQAKEYCYPRREPIDYSLVGLYYDTVLNLTINQKNEDNYNPQIFRDILKECKPNEFCMKIFTHALYVNPKRSSGELIKLRNDLQSWPKSFDITAKKMFKFSYSDMPKEYKSCLLYLAIFPPGYKIRRSTLIGRWVAEGLIFKEDWPSSVRRANRCFDELINRWLAYPDDIGATGKVNSCVVGDQVYGFITKIARKQHIVEARLSRHLARHFSIFNDLQLRSSEKIENFFQGLSKSSRVSMLKVLDLEGCQCFGGKKQRYVNDICTKMLLLKYLSLRGTDITELPSEINHLRELEVLDIRQTQVPMSATVNVLLLKLKRLLAGHTDPREKASSVQIPHNIGKMVKIEVLSNVKARDSRDLTDIGKLWHLRKLGVVVDDKTSHLKSLLQTISDLQECLCSLSITLSTAGTGGNPSNEDLKFEHPPKFLESLSIGGTTQKVHLLPFFGKYGTSLTKLVKVTLSSTSLDQQDLDVLATKLPKLQCVKLRQITYTRSYLTFKNKEFTCLKNLLVEGSNLTDIIFEDGAAPKLEKMVLSSTNIASVSGVNKLQKLEELELKDNNNGRLLSSFDNANEIAKLTLCGTLLEQGDLQILAKKSNMRCLVLLEKSCEISQITFSKDEFPKLNNLIVHCSAITDIIFNIGSVPKLEKIVWSSASVSGIKNIPRLKELEFKGGCVPNLEVIKKDIEGHKNTPSLKYI